MAYQTPAFYFYHAAREAIAITYNITPTLSGNQIHDSRQGELFDFNQIPFGGGTKRIQLELEAAGSPADDLDTIIIAGHNFNGNELNLFSNPVTQGVGNVDRLAPDHVVTEANGTLINLPLTSSTGGDRHATLVIAQGAGANNTPELTEYFLTKKRELVRGPQFGWSHGWRRSQTTATNDAFVTSTQLRGTARKTFTLTWSALEGDDRQTLFDLQEATADWSEPFYFLPPDDDYPLLLMELDRDASWTQDAQAPLDTGTADKVTLPLIQKLG